MLCVILGSIIICFSDDFLIFYLGIELQSLTFYVIATLNRSSDFSCEAGLKYFVFGGVISCFLLLGFSLIYLAFASTSFELLFSLNYSKNNPFFFFGLIFSFFAFLFKIGAAPFHHWLCDVYDGSIISITMVFATIPKLIIFGFLIKLVFFIFFDFFTI